MNMNRFFAGVAFVVLGIGYLLRIFHLTGINSQEIIGVSLIVFALPAAYFSFGKGKRSMLFLSTCMFLLGIIFIIIDRFEILQPKDLIFTSILFMIGAALIILFIDNTKEKIFLYTGMILLLSSVLSIKFAESSGYIRLANKIGSVIIDYWPVFLILVGLSFLFNRE